MTPVDHVDAGARLRAARETARLTQAEAAAALGLPLPMLVALEQGQRSPRIEELQELADLYGLSVNALLRPEAVHFDLFARLRELLPTGDAALKREARVVTDRVRAEIELQNALLARGFGVSPEAMAHRLEELGLVTRGTWEPLQFDGGPTSQGDRHLLAKSGDLAAEPSDAQATVPLRLAALAAEAQRRVILTERQLASLLHLDRVALRKVLEAAGANGKDANGLHRSP